mgnify:CR=1 FL=1
MVFFSSLFGDLIESIMKRDAGMKVGSGLAWRAAVWGIEGAGSWVARTHILGLDIIQRASPIGTARTAAGNPSAALSTRCLFR